MRNILILVLSSFVIFACSINKKTVKSTKEFIYFASQSNAKLLSEANFNYYSDILSFTNELKYNQNQEVESLEFNCDSPDYKTSLELVWEKKTASNTRDNYDIYTQNEQSKSDNFGDFFISHSEDDIDGHDVHVFYDSHSDHFLTREFYTDTFSYERTVELSSDVIAYYKKLKLLLIDSLTFQSKIPFPNFKNCNKLKSSTYTKTETLSRKTGLYKETIIDSTYDEDELEVEIEENIFTDFKSMDENGNLTLIYSDDRKHLKKYYLSSDLRNPISATESFIIDSDTLYTIEMTTQFVSKLRCSKFVIKEKPKHSTNYGNLRLPLINREINIWRNKKGEIVRVHKLATTSQGHKLELDVESGGKVITNKVTIPEISKDQIYPMDFDPLYRLEIYEFDKGPRKPVVKDNKQYYSEIVEDLEFDYDKIESKIFKKKEVWISKDSLVRLEILRY